MAYGTRPSLPKRGSTPDELDPVAASSTPITPDPRTRSKPRINYSPASADPEAIDEVRRRLIANGIDPEMAQAMAEQQVLDNKQGEFDRLDAPGNARQARQQQAAAAEHQRKIDSGYVPTTNPDGSVSYQMAQDMEPLTAQELRDRKQNPYTEPGPRTLDGSPITRPRQLSTEREARNYNTRPQVTDDNRKGRRSSDAAYMPSPRDLAMEARGFFPVTNPDGSVSYSVGTGYYEEGNPRTSADADEGRQIPGGLGRLGPRADLEPGFELKEVRGPNGTVSVYRQNEESKAKQAAYMAERQIARFADASGLTEAELAAMTPAQRRSAVRGAKRADASDREEAWRAQMMLGGGRPTGGIGGSKATVNAWLNLPEDQRASAMRYMLPGGQLSATVDAANATQAGRMAQQAMVAFLQNNPGATPEQRAAAELQLRKGDPAAAGSTDISAGKHGTPEAIKEYERLAASNDTTTLGFSYEDERRLAEALQKPPYNMKQAEAEAKAYEYAEKRRWVSGGGPAGARPAAPGAAPGTPAPPPGSDPRAWGGGA
jgi:hypothetical protein